MKSYYTHLKSTNEYGEKKTLTKKPILRSSGIFPVMHNSNYSTKIHFLGYWLLKRKIPEIKKEVLIKNFMKTNDLQ